MKVWRPACFEEQVSVLALLWRCFPRAQQAAKGVRAQTICGNRLLSAMRFTSAMVHSTPVERAATHPMMNAGILVAWLVVQGLRFIRIYTKKQGLVVS